MRVPLSRFLIKRQSSSHHPNVLLFELTSLLTPTLLIRQFECFGQVSSSENDTLRFMKCVHSLSFGT